MPGRLMVGTSGFAYKEWKPDFYPADLKQADFLRFYAGALPSVEINNTFYRSPTEDLLARWSEQTPEGFAFTLKAPQRITHHRRLGDVEEPLSGFLRAARVLDARLGCILFQLPPTLARDDELLGAFLALLPGKPFRFAMEFRHPSWDAPAVREALGANGVALCIADTDDLDAAMTLTTEAFSYLRLRKTAYDDEALTMWAKRVRTAMDDGADIYAYFKHEDDAAGPRAAARLRELTHE